VFSSNQLNFLVGPLLQHIFTSAYFPLLQTSKAMPFIIGCPACQHNFIQLWCVVTCSPDQASFMNISEVQQAADNNATVVKTVDVWLSPGFMGGLYDSCKVCPDAILENQGYPGGIKLAESYKLKCPNIC
jgi:hypothetical protein